ncbi:hypothetical protein ACRALDRAFT_1069326 [Sodiomyces alcalophilus JCM 7366]|uniref:uncharacterized protein n=1 Tax=Sodiomyces alcalophilus JCM 7366 TaxID=591952 RepID=UPI0039B4ADA8
MSLPPEGSTQPFSNSAEWQGRLDRARTGLLGSPPALSSTPSELDHKLAPTRRESEIKPAPRTADPQLAELREAFRNASLASSLDARLVVAYPPRRSGRNDDSITDSAVIRLPWGAGDWDMVGVVQRTHDVDFTISLPFYDRSYDTPPPHLIPHSLRCRLYYDPAKDDCLLVNRSDTPIYLSCLDSMGSSRDHVLTGQNRVVGPGMWRISVGGDDDIAEEQHLLHMIILRRQYSVTIRKAPKKLPGDSILSKRSAPEEDSEEAAGSKRRRREDDVTEMLLAPTTRAAAGTSVNPRILTLDTRRIVHIGGTPLLNLSDGESAIVRMEQSEAMASRDLASYELSRLERVANTPSASLFTGRHSELSENIVAKVMRYEGHRAEDLIQTANNWKREKRFLEQLHHRNIISLKAFDGRLFAIYVEHLPPSLHRDINSSFTPQDAYSIVRDMSSALAFLAARQIVHNDIKPANIAYSPQRGAVLLDFGMASSEGEIRPGGTPWYLPPEFAVYGPRTCPGDIWALGITMAYVLGKIGLPERTVRGWLIRDLPDKYGGAYSQMNDWLNGVSRAREALNCQNMVEGLVFRMLEGKKALRIHATEIASVFERATPALHA